MRITLSTCALLSAVTLSATERINVVVCNLGGVPAEVVGAAEAEAGYVLRSIDVEPAWQGCDEQVVKKETSTTARFLLRLVPEAHSINVATGVGETMGRAHVSADTPRLNAGGYYYADAYYDSAQKYAASYNIVSASQVLAYIIAHEIGHLFLGPGHAEGTIMAGRWNATHLNEMRHRRLKFNRAQRESICNQLRAIKMGAE